MRQGMATIEGRLETMEHQARQSPAANPELEALRSAQSSLSERLAALESSGLSRRRPSQGGQAHKARSRAILRSRPSRQARRRRPRRWTTARVRCFRAARCARSPLWTSRGLLERKVKLHGKKPSSAGARRRLRTSARRSRSRKRHPVVSEGLQDRRVQGKHGQGCLSLGECFECSAIKNAAFARWRAAKAAAASQESPAHQAIAVSQALRAGIVIALIGCTESPIATAPIATSEIVETTKRWPVSVSSQGERRSSRSGGPSQGRIRRRQA